jgi:cell division protein ZapB
MAAAPGIAMDLELLDTLEHKVEELLAAYRRLHEENQALAGENRQLREERQGLKTRIDAILAKLEGV